jgi:hypothetical protein
MRQTSREKVSREFSDAVGFLTSSYQEKVVVFGRVHANRLVGEAPLLLSVSTLKARVPMMVASPINMVKRKGDGERRMMALRRRQLRLLCASRSLRICVLQIGWSASLPVTQLMS